MRSGVVVSVTVSLVWALMVLASPTTGQTAHSTTRWDGADRYGTAVAISRATYPDGAGAVVIAGGETFPDGLAGGPAAARLNAPLLLSANDTLPAVVAEEIRRLRPSHVHLVGGATAIGPEVEAQVEALVPGGVERLSGTDRYATAAVLASTWDTADTVYLASGRAFPDGLSGGAAAARESAPLLLTGTTALPEPTRAELLRLAPTRVVIVGGAAAVSSAVTDAVSAALPDLSVSRVGGVDRYDTSARLLDAALPHLGEPELVLASGATFADALAGGPASAARSALFAIAEPGCTPRSLRPVVDRSGVSRVVLLGGRAALADDVADKTCPPQITLVSRPTLTGSAKYGSTLKVSPGSWSVGSLTYRYQWMRDGKAISRAVHSTYKAAAADVGHLISAQVRVSRNGFRGGSATTTQKRIAHRVAVRKKVTYRVETRGHVKASVSTFRREAAETLNDARGWRGIGIEFREVSSGGDFTLYLSQAERVPDFSSGCSATWSCRVGRHVIINEDRWTTATSSWRSGHGSLSSYRDMVVNHEVGHWLGHGHRSCPRRGALAPLMQQQSKGLGGCTINPWPTAAERHAPRFGF